MTKTSSSSTTQTQTRPPPPQEGITTMATAHSPLSIDSGNDDNDQSDQKARRASDGLKRKTEEKGAKREDVYGVKKKKSDESSKEEMCRIDVRNEDEKVCRICQLSSDQLLTDGVDNGGNNNLVLLGCACKGELGISHYNCALAWFQQKGNRTCEICEKPAKNIEGIEDTGFRAYGSDIATSREIGMITADIYERDQRCSKLFCNFLLVTLLLAFLLPWAIHPSKLL